MLKPCKYRFRTSDPNIFRCITDKLIHSGTVPTTICEICPYCTIERNDFFKQTNKLFISTKQSYIRTSCCSG